MRAHPKVVDPPGEAWPDTKIINENGGAVEQTGAETLLAEVVDRYLTSGDFNDLYLDGDDGDLFPDAAELVSAGLAEVVGERDYPNPHIRP